MHELDALNSEIQASRKREVSGVIKEIQALMQEWSISIADLTRYLRPQAGTPSLYRAARSLAVSQETRARVQTALAALPNRRGKPTREYYDQLLSGIQVLAQAWHGSCLSAEFPGADVPLEFECAAGHRFQMLIHGLRLGHWCHACAYDRATLHTLDEAHTIAAQRGGECLSRRYRARPRKMRWRCEAGHTWSAAFEGVLKGDWCQQCHLERIRPKQDDFARVATAHGGRCLSAYVDKETPLQWQCAEGHTWFAPWSRVSKGEWCHQCAAKARTRTIEDLREVAQSRGGRCLSDTYLGVHEKHEWECMDKHVWQATANSVYRGSWCPECAWESRRMARNEPVRIFVGEAVKGIVTRAPA
ncbi:hypothetical protein ACFPAA_02915 [Paraburkholderia caffeinitolerans]